MNTRARRPRARQALEIVWTALFVTVAASFDAAWAAGELDPSFGTGGLVVSSLSPAADVARAVAILPDGRIVVGGSGFGGELTLARYGTDGALDPTFGTNGVVRGGIAGEATDLLLRPDGAIVATVPYGSSAVIVTRYLSDGTLDDSFFYPFGHGRIYMPLTVGPDGQGGLVYDPQYAGGFVIGGAYDNERRFALERVTDEGWGDSGFGAFFGFCTLPIGTDGDAELWDVGRLPDGTFVAVGSASSGGHTDFALARFDRNGCPDPSFGSNGAVITPILAGADEVARSVVVQPDGKIVVLGDTGGAASAFALVRYRADGSLDPTFGDGGIALVHVGLVDVARDLVSSTDGGFVVGGQADGLFTLVRLDSTGHVDPAFGTSGVVQITQPPFDPCCSELYALAFQRDRRIVAVGTSVVDEAAAAPDVALAQLLANTCGDGTVDFGETCDDGNTSAGDCCSPRCRLDPPDAACADDGLRCTRDVCDGAGACVHPLDEPIACRTSTIPGGARIAMTNGRTDSRDRLAWTWRRGAAIALEELGDPTTTTGYVLCGSVGSTLAFELDAPPAGGMCRRHPYWTARASGYRYRCPDAGTSGTTNLFVTAGAAGKSRAGAKGHGSSLSLPALPLGTPLRVQLRSDEGLCIESVFSAPVRNDAGRFEARSDP